MQSCTTSSGSDSFNDDDADDVNGDYDDDRIDINEDENHLEAKKICDLDCLQEDHPNAMKMALKKGFLQF